MFLIAYLTGMDVKDLASMNNMKEPYSLSVGQNVKNFKFVQLKRLPRLYQ